MQQRPSLGDIPFFRHLSEEEKEEFEDLLEPASFTAGQTVFREGGPEETLYVISSGILEVYKEVLPGRRQLLAMVEAPTVVGEMGLLTEPRAAASVEARTPVEAHGIDRDRFLEMLDADSPAACKVVHEIGRTLAQRMDKTDAAIAAIVARLEAAGAYDNRDADVFRDTLIQEWHF